MKQLVTVGSGAHVSEPKACVGWGVSVYWRAAGVFQEATVSSYDTASGQHALVYASGEEEELHLGHQCLKWCHPPAPEQVICSLVTELEILVILGFQNQIRLLCT